MENHIDHPVTYAAWNKGRLIGQKAPLGLPPAARTHTLGA